MTVTLRTIDMHTGGEPTRIILEGWPPLEAPTLLGKRREAREKHDHLRRALMHEPRGHAEMYGALLVPPDHPEADLAVLFMHNEGYSTMCGHATIALARWAVDSGRVRRTEPETTVRLQCPCGLVTAHVAIRGGHAGRVRFESVPGFAFALDAIVPTETWGPVTVDIGYGGAFYAFLDAASIGLDVHATPIRALVDAGETIAETARRFVPLQHPDDPDLAFIYGTIFTDGGTGATSPSRNICIFAGRQVDRSPTGSGVTARIALQVARRQTRLGQACTYESVTGAHFTGHAVRETTAGGRKAVIVEVAGEAHYTGENVFRLEDDDPLRWGFTI
ncbi:proline racemase family protein [Vineibacter terrae]|uniref:proline racemase family protein n=1 Tax=Vineibacter terrae TaxID=2586908 RepID=UPI002E36BF92|nr:proline racemase family protein [Vineibacter terrae]HEX2891322.1 proline racemase family protein [Vineibacter terrae]